MKLKGTDIIIQYTDILLLSEIALALSI